MARLPNLPRPGRRASGPRSAQRRARTGLLVRLTAFVAATGLITAFIGAQIARLSFEDGWPVTATFDDVSGLAVGDDVKVAGAPVGRVEEMKIVDGRAEVRMTVNEGVTVPSDSEAAVRWRDAMGSRVVYLIPGSSPTPMKPGAHIERTRSVVDAGALIDQLAPLTESVDPVQVNTVLVSLAQALEGNAGEIDRLIVNVDELSQAIAARRRTLQRMLDDYASITEIIARRDKQIGQAVDGLVDLSAAFADNRRMLDEAVVQLAAMARTSDKVIAGNSKELASVVARLAAFTSGVRRNVDSLGKVLETAGPKLQHIFGAVDNGTYMEVAIPCLSLAAPPCPYPTKLPGARPAGSSGDPSTQPAADRTGSAGTPVDSAGALRRLLVGGA